MKTRIRRLHKRVLVMLGKGYSRLAMTDWLRKLKTKDRYAEEERQK